MFYTLPGKLFLKTLKGSNFNFNHWPFLGSLKVIHRGPKEFLFVLLFLFQ